MEQNADHKVIVVDPSSNKEGDKGFKLAKKVKMYIHTGNVATWNSLKTRKTQIPANELHHCMKRTVQNWLDNVSEKENINSYNGDETFDSDEERSLIRVTVKILLHKFDIKYLEEAVKTTLESMKIKFFDTLILALPHVEESSRPYQEIILPFWKEMEKLHSSGVAQKLSSCDLDKEKLESLVDVATVKPEINQVNLTSCCHMPQDLVNYAKSKDISLQTHGDLPVMLPEQAISDITKLVEPENELQWSANWVVRYVVLIKCRGVIKSKGYIAAVEGSSS